MPITDPVWVISELPARAMPKSVTRARPSASISTLWGFMSRWTIPFLCAKRAASSTWRVTSTAAATVIPSLIRSLSESPSTYSIEM